MFDEFAKVASDLDLEAAVRAAAKHGNDLLPLRIEDKLGGNLGSRFAGSLKRKMEQAQYDPDVAIIVPVPKPGWTTRPAALLSLEDRAVYEALVETLRDRLGKFLVSPEVCLWPRAELSAKKRWKDFETAPIHHGANYVVSADVTAFYDSISHRRLGELIDSATGRIEVSRALVLFLARTMRRDRGIPQGLVPSDALATLFLQEVDSDLLRAGFDYWRHGDDIRIAADSYSDAQMAISHLEMALRKVGLVVNSAKCVIYQAKTYSSELEAEKAPIDSIRASIKEARLRNLEEDTEEFERVIAEFDEEQLGWDVFYHASISIEEAVASIAHKIHPTDTEVFEDIFFRALEEAPGIGNGKMSKALFHQRLQYSLMQLTAARSKAPLERAGELLTSFPDKAEILCAYLNAMRGTSPNGVLKAVEKYIVSAAFKTPWQDGWILLSALPLAQNLDTNSISALSAKVDFHDAHPLSSIASASILASAGALQEKQFRRLLRICPAPLMPDLVKTAFLARKEGWASKYLDSLKPNLLGTLVHEHLANAPAVASPQTPGTSGRTGPT